MAIKQSHNITLTTLFHGNESAYIESSTSAINTSGYTGMQIDFDTVLYNAIDTFNVNGNIVNVSGSTLGVVLPNAAAIGVDMNTGNWVINGVVTSNRARGIDGTVTFDELTKQQKSELTFTSAIVHTLMPGQLASASIIDNLDEGQTGALQRTLQLSIPKGDRGDILWAQFQIDSAGMLNMIVQQNYQGIQFTVDEQGMLCLDTSYLQHLQN